MKKYYQVFILIMVIFVLILSGCSGTTGTPASDPTTVSNGSSTEVSLVASSTSKPVESASTEVPSVTSTPAVIPTSGPAVCEPTGKLLTADPSYPEVTAEDWIDGPDTATVTIMEYSEFQCPYCAQLEPELLKLRQAYPDDVRLVFRHFPLVSIHPNAHLASQAAEAVGKQKSEYFFNLKSLLFAEQATWSGLSTDEFRAWLKVNVEMLGADVDQFEKDLDSQEVIDKIDASIESGTTSGVQGTPTVLFNGVPYGGPRDYDTLVSIVKLFQLENNLYDACPPMEVDPAKQYQAILHTTKGDITIDLMAAEAPMAVNNFIFLAKEGYYDNVPFHRVLEGFVAQAGDPSGTGYGGPGYRFSNEINEDSRFDEAGLVAMANAGTSDSNGSQFFITYDALPQLDGGYTIFGKVSEGMDVVDQLTLRDPSSTELLPEADLILSITIEEK